MAVTPNTTTTTQITTEARNIDFVSRFVQDWKALGEIMGIMRPIKKAPGTKLYTYTAKVTLQSGTVAEGDEVPLSQAQVTPKEYADLTFNKYRKRVTAEAVNKYGAEIAVQKTDTAFIKEITDGILGEFYDFLATGTLTGTATTLQQAIASAIGKVKDKFKKLHLSHDEIVVFVNTMDVYNYLGTANITLQTRNGIEYVKDFLGASTVIVSSEIAEGKVIATPASNIVLYYADVSGSDFAALGLNYTVPSDPSGLIGVARTGEYGRVSGDVHAIYGMKLFAEYLDGIAVNTISPAKTV